MDAADGPARRDRIYGLVFLAVAIAAIYGSVRLGLGTPQTPDPGFFPFVAALTLAALSLLVVINCLRGRGEPAEAFGSVRAPAMVVGGLVLFVATLDTLGYILAATLLAAIMLIVFEVRRPLAYLIALPVASVGSYFLFHALLRVPLPGGLLGDWTF